MEFFNALVEIISNEIQLHAKLDQFLQQPIERLIPVLHYNGFSQQVSAHKITSFAAGGCLEIPVNKIEFLFGQSDVQPSLSAIVLLFHNFFFFINPLH